jgi:lipopolysaccharide biosynthesis regulator YciM
MYGPAEVADARGVYFEWKCPECGFICHKFRWEWPAEEPQDPTIRTLRDYYNDRSYQK